MYNLFGANSGGSFEPGLQVEPPMLLTMLLFNFYYIYDF